MKQKYVVLLDNAAEKLAIQEYAELDKEMLSLLCEETYDIATIKAAMDKDRRDLIQALRTHNMYPPGTYMERIADAIVEMFQPGANTSAELFFEEREMFQTIEEKAELEPDDSDDDETDEDVDDLLDEDLDDDLEEKELISGLKKSIKSSDKNDTGEDA